MLLLWPLIHAKGLYSLLTSYIACHRLASQWKRMAWLTFFGVFFSPSFFSNLGWGFFGFSKGYIWVCRVFFWVSSGMLWVFFGGFFGGFFGFFLGFFLGFFWGFFRVFFWVFFWVFLGFFRFGVCGVSLGVFWVFLEFFWRFLGGFGGVYGVLHGVYFWGFWCVFGGFTGGFRVLFWRGIRLKKTSLTSLFLGVCGQISCPWVMSDRSQCCVMHWATCPDALYITTGPYDSHSVALRWVS